MWCAVAWNALMFHVADSVLELAGSMNEENVAFSSGAVPIHLENGLAFSAGKLFGLGAVPRSLIKNQCRSYEEGVFFLSTGGGGGAAPGDEKDGASLTSLTSLTSPACFSLFTASERHCNERATLFYNAAGML